MLSLMVKLNQILYDYVHLVLCLAYWMICV